MDEVFLTNSDILNLEELLNSDWNNFSIYHCKWGKIKSPKLAFTILRELDHKIILEKVLKKDMKVFDIGANIGYYVLMESSILGINGRIVAVEPVPKNMHLLKKNLELNKNNITTTFQVGLSNLIENYLSDKITVL